MDGIWHYGLIDLLSAISPHIKTQNESVCGLSLTNMYKSQEVGEILFLSLRSFWLHTIFFFKANFAICIPFNSCWLNSIGVSKVLITAVCRQCFTNEKKTNKQVPRWEILWVTILRHPECHRHTVTADWTQPRRRWCEEYRSPKILLWPLKKAFSTLITTNNHFFIVL